MGGGGVLGVGDRDTHTPKYSQRHAEDTSDWDASPNSMTEFSVFTCPSAGQRLGLFLTIIKKKHSLNQTLLLHGGIPVVVQQCDSMDEHTFCIYALYIRLTEMSSITGEQHKGLQYNITKLDVTNTTKAIVFSQSDLNSIYFFIS